jgi:hypothetical protein
MAGSPLATGCPACALEAAMQRIKRAERMVRMTYSLLTVVYDEQSPNGKNLRIDESPAQQSPEPSAIFGYA